MLCPNCVSDLLISEDFDTIQATNTLSVHYECGLIRLQREGAAIIVVPREIRYLLNALVEAAPRVVGELFAGIVRWLESEKTFRSAALIRMSILIRRPTASNLGRNRPDCLESQV